MGNEKRTWRWIHDGHTLYANIDVYMNMNIQFYTIWHLMHLVLALDYPEIPTLVVSKHLPTLDGIYPWYYLKSHWHPPYLVTTCEWWKNFEEKKVLKVTDIKEHFNMSRSLNPAKSFLKPKLQRRNSSGSSPMVLVAYAPRPSQWPPTNQFPQPCTDFCCFVALKPGKELSRWVDTNKHWVRPPFPGCNQDSGQPGWHYGTFVGRVSRTSFATEILGGGHTWDKYG